MKVAPLLVVLAAGALSGCHESPSSRPAAAASPQRAAGGRDVSITACGAVADGTTLNTAAIQRAIDQVAGSGGGTVVIPAGTFMSGALFLKPGVNLHLDAGATLKGSPNVADYPRRMTRIEGHSQEWVPALVNASSADGLRVDGAGTLDGSGQGYWTAFRTTQRAVRGTKNLDVPRPRLIFVENSRDVRIAGIHLRDSGFWNLHLYRCRGVTVEGVEIRSRSTLPGGSPSTDGIDIDSSQDVTVRDCTIAVGDDCIALKGSKGPLAGQDAASPPVEHIRITGCTFEAGGGVATCGSEATVVRDVVVENCRLGGGGGDSRGIKLVQLKLRPDTPQRYEDIHFRHITLDGGGAIFAVAPWRQYFDLQGQPAPAAPGRVVRDITLEDVHGTFGSFGSISWNEGDLIEGIRLDQVRVTLRDPQLRGAATGILAKDVTVNGMPWPGRK